MANINIDKYFSSEERYDPSCMITILSDMLGMSFEEIKKNVNSLVVTVTSDQIEEYLNQKFEEEKPDLKKRIENRTSPRKGIKDLVHITREEIKQSSKILKEDIEASRYYFTPYSLKYFQIYSQIVKNKSIRLLNIIECLANKDIEAVQDNLKSLDIKLDKDCKISKIDVTRLVIPTIANINILGEKVSEANNLSTYLTFKSSIHSLYRHDISEGEIYPISELQYLGNGNDRHEDYVPLSENQKASIQRDRRKTGENAADTLVNFGIIN